MLIPPGTKRNNNKELYLSLFLLAIGLQSIRGGGEEIKGMTDVCFSSFVCQGNEASAFDGIGNIIIYMSVSDIA